MKCPQCGLVTFDDLPACPRCKESFALVRPLASSSLDGARHVLRDDPELRLKLRDRLHRARLDRRKQNENPLATGSDPDAPDWFDPEAGGDNGAQEAGFASISGADEREEGAIVHSDDLSPQDELRGGAATAESDGEIELVEASREDDDQEPEFRGDIPGFSDWREELRERLKRIRARREQERAAAEAAAEAEPAAAQETAVEPEAPAPQEAVGEQEPAAEPQMEAASEPDDTFEPTPDAAEAQPAPGVDAAGEAATAGDIIARIVDGPEADLDADVDLSPAAADQEIDFTIDGDGPVIELDLDEADGDEPVIELDLDEGDAAEAPEAIVLGEKEAGPSVAADAADETLDADVEVVSPAEDTDAVPLEQIHEPTAPDESAVDLVAAEAEAAEPRIMDDDAIEPGVAEAAEVVELHAVADEPGKAVIEAEEAVDTEPVAIGADDEDSVYELELEDAGEEPAAPDVEEPAALGAEDPVVIDAEQLDDTEAAVSPDEALDDIEAGVSHDEALDDTEAGVSRDEALAELDELFAEDVAVSEDEQHAAAEPHAEAGDELPPVVTPERGEDEAALELDAAVDDASPEFEFEPAEAEPSPEIDVAAADEGEAQAIEWDSDEAAAAATVSTAGPLGERAAATLCDALVLTAIGAALVGAASSGTEVPFRQILVQEALWLGLAWSIFAVGYSVFFVGSCGQTIGRMVMRLRVVGDDQFSVGFGRAAVRLAAWVVSALPAFAGMLLALRDPKRRALHDRLSHTRVVKA